MVGSILSAAGCRTGFFRSPHLTTYRERIAVGDFEISEDSWLRVFRLVYPVVEAMRTNALPGYSLGRPTLFEVIFTMACLHFASEKVEWAAVETGLGGRLDATNLLQSDVAAITNVSLEHTQILGKTVTEIAGEKAAIIKAGSHAVTGATDPDALTVIEARARDVGTPLLRLGREMDVDVAGSRASSQDIILRAGSRRVEAQLPLGGRHQAWNAGVAFGAILALRERCVPIGDDAIRKGLECARVPGRLELFPGEPTVILDGAHNAAGAQALAEALTGLATAPTTLLFAAMDDKDIEAMAEAIAPLVDGVIVTPVPGTNRSGTTQRLQQAFSQAGKPVTCVEDIREAFRSSLWRTPPEGRLVVAGSMYLIGAIRPLLVESRQ
jgi:dihydrofolate synthase/folylpolyglutamate synthase